MLKVNKVCLLIFLLSALGGPAWAQSVQDTSRHAVPTAHPRLLGPVERLRELARDRENAYTRTKNAAHNPDAGDHEKMISLAIVAAVEDDSAYAREAIGLALNYINAPVRIGHETFGHDLARCAIVYDFCWKWWTAQERSAFHTYMNATVDANTGSETSPFHNGWYGYKNWGIGLACYATWYENPRAPSILAVTENDFRTRAGPALEMAGDGGGWAEGYYVNYWNYEWIFFCEAARWCEGLDYYELAPKFFRNRAVATMFETYPGIREYGSRRSIPMGDGGGRVYGGDRDKVLSVRRVLVSRYRDDPVHQVVNAFNETTPRSATGVYAYKDLLWRDTTVVKGDLSSFKLSHYSPGPGYVYARSSWNEDATYFFFKCGDRFTSHQHLDNGQFLIYKYEELAGDGGHYETFGSSHDVNYHLRTIAHSTILIDLPGESWPDIRVGTVSGNDGGQHHNWPHHNGAVEDPQAWLADRQLYDIADMLAVQDAGDYLYMAGDCSRSNNSLKLDYFTRQIVFIRPGTFVIFDRVKAKKLSYKKTWLLQAMKVPERRNGFLVVTNGRGRLFVQTLLPAPPIIQFYAGDSLYTYGGRNYPPEFDTGPAPECRVAISPLSYTAEDLFLNVLTATDSTVSSVEAASSSTKGDTVTVKVGRWSVSFTVSKVGFAIASEGCTLPGDVDGDGEVGMADVLEIIRFAAGIKTPSDVQKTCADLNGDDRINVLDVVACLIRSARPGH